MGSYEFSAPWLNGRPIAAPNKIDMINWYSQTDGYFPDATENDSRNSLLSLFRFQGKILYEDEFCSGRTTNYDCSQTIGRVSRVFRGIDMIGKYKAACEDGADLSKSIVVDFEIVWRDYEENILPYELMHNLQLFECELKKRSPENSPVRAFWMGQEIQRLQWASGSRAPGDLYLDYPSTIGSPVVSGYYSTQEYTIGEDAQNPPIMLNPMTADFVPTNNGINLLAQAQEYPASTKFGSINAPREQAAPAIILTVAELIAKGRKEYNWGERDDESWPGDDIFIPTFCRPKQPWSKPHILGPGYVAPKIESVPGTKLTEDSASIQDPQSSTKEPRKDLHDSGYSSGGTPPHEVQYAAATAGNSGEDADEAVLETEGEQLEQSERGRDADVGTFLAYPASYRALRYLEYHQGREEDMVVTKRNRIHGWLNGMVAPTETPRPELTIAGSDGLNSDSLICHWLEAP